MEVNYLGSVYPTRAVITTMKERRMGRIMFVSSQAGQIGLFGYTPYSPSKFALRGLAESLQMEVSVWSLITEYPDANRLFVHNHFVLISPMLKDWPSLNVPLQIKPYNIYVTVAYPPDTDTPGLAEENKTKVNITYTRHCCIDLFFSSLFTSIFYFFCFL